MGRDASVSFPYLRVRHDEAAKANRKHPRVPDALGPERDDDTVIVRNLVSKDTNVYFFQERTHERTDGRTDGRTDKRTKKTKEKKLIFLRHKTKQIKQNKNQ